MRTLTININYGGSPLLLFMTNDMLGTRTRATYLSINADGKFVQSFKEAQEGTVSRENKNKKIVHEKFFDFITGYVHSVNVKDHKDFGEQWEIVLTKGDNKVIITLGYASNYAKPFLKMLPNIDISKEVEISPSAKMEGTEKKTSLFIKQNDVLVPYAFTSTNPNGMPERTLIKVKGKDKWDYTDQLEFLFEKAQEKLGESSGVITDTAEGVEVEAEKATNIDDIDSNEDVPF